MDNYSYVAIALLAICGQQSTTALECACDSTFNGTTMSDSERAIIKNDWGRNPQYTFSSQTCVNGMTTCLTEAITPSNPSAVAQCFYFSFDVASPAGTVGVLRDCVFVTTDIARTCQNQTRPTASQVACSCDSESLCNLHPTIPTLPPVNANVNCSCMSIHNNHPLEDALRIQLKQKLSNSGLHMSLSTCLDNATVCNTGSFDNHDPDSQPQCVEASVQSLFDTYTLRDCAYVERSQADACQTFQSSSRNGTLCYCGKSDYCNINILPTKPPIPSGLECSCESTLYGSPLDDVTRNRFKQLYGRHGLSFDASSCTNGASVCSITHAGDHQPAVPQCISYTDLEMQVVVRDCGYISPQLAGVCDSLGSGTSLCTCGGTDRCNSFIVA